MRPVSNDSTDTTEGNVVALADEATAPAGDDLAEATPSVGQAEASGWQAVGQFFKRLPRMRLFLPVVCLVVLLLINTIVTAILPDKSPVDFFRITVVNGHLKGSLIDILDYSSGLIIVSIGMMIVIACSKGVDISVGAVMALASAVCVWLVGYGELSKQGNNWTSAIYVYPLALGFLVGLVMGAICGIWNGFLVSKLKIQPMIATLILYTGGRGIAKVVTHGQQNRISAPGFNWATIGVAGIPIPVAILVAAGFVAVVALVLRFTAVGMDVQAVGINDRASRIAGLKSSRVILLAFVFCGVCAAAYGLITTSRIGGIDPSNNGKLVELDAILAVALGGNSLNGGKFSLAGTVIGAITVQALPLVLYSINVSAVQLPFYKAVVVIIIVTLQSTELRPMLARATAWLRGRSAVARPVVVLAQEAGE